MPTKNADPEGKEKGSSSGYSGMRILAPSLVALFVAGLGAGCSGSPSPASRSPDPSAPAVAEPSAEVPSGITARSLFCAYGGVGLVPDPLPPGYETMFVSMVFELDNPGPPVAGVSVAGASLRDAGGAPLASLVRLDHFVDLSREPAPDPTWGSFAIYLNGTGTPFTGTLPTGTTRLRIHYAISSAAGLPYPDHCRAELSTSAGPLVIEGPIDGVWPTS